MPTACPICSKPVVITDSNVLPFCSERCKLIDLGRWLRGAYQIPVLPEDDSSDERDSLAADGEAQ